jgi:hypothetical protein
MNKLRFLKEVHTTILLSLRHLYSESSVSVFLGTTAAKLQQYGAPNTPIISTQRPHEPLQANLMQMPC